MTGRSVYVRRVSEVQRRRYAKRLQPSERREQVLDAALRVIVEAGNFHVTMEAVAAEAGVTKPVVYDYFANRAELIAALLDRELERAADVLSETVPDLFALSDVDPDEFVVDRTVAWLERLQQSPDTWRLLMMPPAGAPPELRERVEEVRESARTALKLLLAWGVEKRGGPEGLDIDLLAHMMLAMAQRGGELFLSDPEEHTPERFAEFARTLLAQLPRGGG
jgi:AcrR family transcriptional regulator